jgi:hypothetical protein
MTWLMLSVVGVIFVLVAALGVVLAWVFPRWSEGWQPNQTAPRHFNCPACHRIVPDSALQCSNCGCPFED